MKTLLMLSLFPCVCFGQKIAENKVDDFTHHKVVRTSWEPLVRKFGGHTIIMTRISQIDENKFLDVRIMRDTGPFAIKEKGELMLKTEMDSIITLLLLKTELSCTGCGAVGATGSGLAGMNISFPLTDSEAKYLTVHPTRKIRIYFFDGYWEEEVKEKSATMLINELHLIN